MQITCATLTTGGTDMGRKDIIREYLTRLARETGYSPTYVTETRHVAPYKRMRHVPNVVNVSWHEETRPKPKRHAMSGRLTASMRELISAVRDIASRERVATEDMAALARESRRGNVSRTARALERERANIVGYVAVTEQWDPQTWRGLTTSRESRYAERGRGTAAKVSIRDNHVTPLLLRGLRTVGVATHPDASDADYVMLVNTMRANPSWCTLRRMMPGPHGYTPLLSTIVPVSHYTEQADAARAARKAHVAHAATQVAPRQSDSVRLAHVIGYAGDVS